MKALLVMDLMEVGFLFEVVDSFVHALGVPGTPEAPPGVVSEAKRLRDYLSGVLEKARAMEPNEAVLGDA